MADDLETERLNKQNYLRDEIISGGYDPNNFKEFLDSIKEDGGSNVDLWTLDELHQVVSDYKLTLKAREQGRHNAWESNEQLQQGELVDKKFEQSDAGVINEDLGNFGEFKDIVFEEKKVEPNPKSGIQYPEIQKPNKAKTKVRRISDEMFAKKTKEAEQDDNNEELFFKEKKCVKSGTTSLNGVEDLEISISGTEVVKGGLLSKSYAVYIVTVKPKGWTVRRRFDDFEWLRSYLVKQYPYMIVPPITTKTKLKKPGPDIIKRRMAFFEKFLTNCLEYPEIMGNKLFEAFLRVDSEKQWKEFKKEGDKIKRPQRLEEMIKADGKITIKTSPELTDHVCSAAEFVLSSNSIYAKMRMLAKELQNQFDQVSNTIFNIGECFTQLYNNASDFNHSVSIGRSKELENVYLALNNVMVSWGGQLTGQIKLVQDGLENFFKYSDLEGDAIKDIIKQSQIYCIDYTKQKKSLNAKLEKLNEGKLPKEKSLVKDIQHLEELKDVYGFYCYETFSQINHILAIKCKHYTRNFIQFARNQNQNLSDLFTHWSDSIMHLDTNKAPDRKESTLMDRSQFRPNEAALDVEED